MEIAPIAGIRAMPVVRPQKADPELSAVFDIDNYARIEDETFTPSDRKPADGAEEEGAEESAAEQQAAEPEAEDSPQAAGSPSEVPDARQINLFA
jgi:hypothetical protein